MVICLERGAHLHMAQLMPLPLTLSCFSKIHIGFTFLVPAHPGSPRQKAVKRVGVCVCVCTRPRLFKPLLLSKVNVNTKLTFDAGVDCTCKTRGAGSCQQCLQNTIKTKLSRPLCQRSLASWLEWCVLHHDRTNISHLR